MLAFDQDTSISRHSLFFLSLSAPPPSPPPLLCLPCSIRTCAGSVLYCILYTQEVCGANLVSLLARQCALKKIVPSTWSRFNVPGSAEVFVLYVCICVCVFVCVCVRVFVYIYHCNTHTRKHSHTHTHSLTLSLSHTHTHTNAHTRTRTRARAHTHTHTASEGTLSRGGRGAKKDCCQGALQTYYSCLTRVTHTPLPHTYALDRL